MRLARSRSLRRVSRCLFGTREFLIEAPMDRSAGRELTGGGFRVRRRGTESHCGVICRSFNKRMDGAGSGAEAWRRSRRAGLCGYACNGWILLTFRPVISNASADAGQADG